MASGQRDVILREIDRVFSGGPIAGMGEGQLLNRFTAGRDPVAFEALLALHGPMVLGVCRRNLRDPHDVEDAFQATFLVLVRRAGALRGFDQLGPWLHGVAVRVARRARDTATRQHERDRRGGRSEAVADHDLVARDELRAVLDEEIARLPGKDRRAVVLCYLEGRTHDEAARQLRCTSGAVRGRLDRARARLRTRLVRRGLAAPAALFATALAADVSSAAVPSPLAASTAAAVMPGAASASAQTLAAAVVRSLWVAKLKVTACLLAAGVVVLGALPLALASARPQASEEARQRAAVAAPVPDQSNDAGAVEGRVLDRAGRPIVGARVARGSDPKRRPGSETTTNADGHFAFHDVPPGALVLTVQARGHAPQMQSLAADRGRGPVEFQLGPGRTISGRIVDFPDGKPIVGAPVAVESWRGQHSLEWRSLTDSDGWFRWDDAPDDDVLIDIGALGYDDKRFMTVKAGQAERTIEMPRPRFVRGSVTDADSGEPIKTYTIIPGHKGDESQPQTWEYEHVRRFSETSYEIKLGAGYRDFIRGVRVEAEGYEPAFSPSFPQRKTDEVFNVKLRRARWLGGVVRRPDGSLAIGIEVVLVTRAWPHLSNGRPMKQQGHRVMRTGPDGQFAIPPEPPPWTVVALDDRGFAEATHAQFAASPELTLRPWGRVEGALRIGSRPAVGQSLSLGHPEPTRRAEATPVYNASTRTDSTGKFAFDRVVPGRVDIYRMVPIGGGVSSGGVAASTTVASGETVRVSLGGTGRPVVGKLAAPDGLPDRVDWSNALIDITAEPLSTRGWSTHVKPAHDGTFRAEDLEAGLYMLTITLRRPPPTSESCPLGSDRLAWARRSVVVPEMAGGRSDEPLDIGTISLQPEKVRRTITVADGAPAFRVDALDGPPIALADYRGRFVLVVFWATWCAPCVAEIPELKAVHVAFGNDPRFAIVGLSLDDDRDVLRTFAAAHGMTWSQGFLGAFSKAAVVGDYGVLQIPSVWLIGPDGRVLANDLRGKAIREAVATALKRR